MRFSLLSHCLLTVTALASVITSYANNNKLTGTAIKTSTANLHPSVALNASTTSCSTLKGISVDISSSGVSIVSTSKSANRSSTSKWSTRSYTHPDLESFPSFYTPEPTPSIGTSIRSAPAHCPPDATTPCTGFVTLPTSTFSSATNVGSAPFHCPHDATTPCTEFVTLPTSPPPHPSTNGTTPCTEIVALAALTSSTDFTAHLPLNVRGTPHYSNTTSPCAHSNSEISRTLQFTSTPPYRTNTQKTTLLSSTGAVISTSPYPHTLTGPQWANTTVPAHSSTGKPSISSHTSSAPASSTITTAFSLPSTTSNNWPSHETNKLNTGTTCHTKATPIVTYKHKARSAYNSTTTSPHPSATIEPFEKLKKRYADTMQGILSNLTGTCSTDNVFVRRSWSTMSIEDRKDYLKAVSCMHGNSRPMYPAINIWTQNVRFRVDDFVRQRTQRMFLDIFSGTFFFQNRYYLTLYEMALREECGYKGFLPYWDFSQHSENITRDPIFSNDAASMGGNGSPYPGGHGPVQVDYYNLSALVPPGTGGGCIYNPPFRGITARYGITLRYDADISKITVYPLPDHNAQYDPVFTLDPHVSPDDVKSPFFYNDRCITRDLNPAIGQLLNTSRVAYDLSCPDLKCLQERLNGRFLDDYPYPYNLLNTARFAVGGLQLDPMTSPTDPIFWMIHTNIDRLFSIWQSQDPKQRFNQVTGNRYPFGDDYNVGAFAGNPYNQPNTLETNLTMEGLDPFFGPPKYLNPNYTWVRPITNFTETLGVYLCYYYE